MLKIKAKLVTISEQDETHESLQEGQRSHAVFAQLLHLGLCVILLSNKGSSLLLLAVVVLVSVVVLMTYTCSSLDKGNSWPCDHPVHNCNTLFVHHPLIPLLSCSACYWLVARRWPRAGQIQKMVHQLG